VCGCGRRDAYAVRVTCSCSWDCNKCSVLGDLCFFLVPSNRGLAGRIGGIERGQPIVFLDRLWLFFFFLLLVNRHDNPRRIGGDADKSASVNKLGGALSRFIRTVSMAHQREIRVL
jgi:hypothetical protein